MATGLGAQECFLFDLNGYLVIRALRRRGRGAQRRVAAHAHEAVARTAALKNAREDGAFGAAGARRDLGGMLGWDDGDPFRGLLAHPRIAPYLAALLGDGYRLDHQPMALLQDAGSEGFGLHGGPLTGAGDLNPELQYRCVNGKPWNALVAMAAHLVDAPDGAGGFCVVKGSHKLNFPVPTAGDVVLFSEATVHGALPWTMPYERRLALYRFSGPNYAYGRAYLNEWSGAAAKCTPQQAAVLLPPFAPRLERPLTTGAGDAGPEPVVRARAPAKKAHDVAASEYHCKGDVVCGLLEAFKTRTLHYDQDKKRMSIKETRRRRTPAPSRTSSSPHRRPLAGYDATYVDAWLDMDRCDPRVNEEAASRAQRNRPRRTRPPPPPGRRTPSDKTKSPRDKGGKGERGPGRGKDAKGDGRGTPGPRARGARADDGKLLSEQPGSANRRTRGTGTGERHAGTVVYICASYGFIRMDTSDGAKEEDVFMHLVGVDFAGDQGARGVRARALPGAEQGRRGRARAGARAGGGAGGGGRGGASEEAAARRRSRRGGHGRWARMAAPTADQSSRLVASELRGWMQATGRKELAAGDLPLFRAACPNNAGADLADACGASAGALEYVGGDVVCRLKAGTYAKPPPAPPAAPPRRPAADDGKAERKPREPRERKPPREPRTGPAADKFIVRRLRTMFLGGLRWDEGKGPATDAELGDDVRGLLGRAGHGAGLIGLHVQRDRQLAYAEFADDATMQAALDAARARLSGCGRAPAGDKGPRRAKGDRPARRARASGDKPGDKPADAAAASETKPGGAADAAAAAAPAAADAAPQTTKA
ncbi:phytanoyl-CoA dioxygenase [Aureococcus anophagefferens]|nr:phytanoyl-CoA dioxygenase [Aureococcus anophagefferens]